MENTPSPYHWNWAEQEEAAAAHDAQRAGLVKSCPHLPTYVEALTSRLNRQADRPDLNSTTPDGFDGTPSRVGFLACCMLNPRVEDAMDWLDWATQGLGAPEKSRLSIGALEQIRLNHGPISLLAAPVMRAVLALIANEPVDQWPSLALVNLFQPTDVGRERAEDAPYAPCCRALLQAGARPDFRNPKGQSALSGLNHLLTELELSMAEPSKSMDLMLCAELILDAGGHPDMVRPMPPLESLVSREDFRLMLLSRLERVALLQCDNDQARPTRAHRNPPRGRTNTRL